jgi:glutamine cyclotransferase
MKFAAFAFIALPLLAGVACTSSAGANPGTTAQQTAPPAKAGAIPVYSFDYVNVYPHDKGGFTQGLLWHKGVFYESDGLYNFSSLRKVEIVSGKVLKRIPVPNEFFAEGLALFGDKLYQLTWMAHKGFIYDRETFKKLGEFKYDGEGWGLTNDDKSLILSDGTNEIRFLDPATFKVQRKISVFVDNDPRLPMQEINELEYVKGEIYANIWGSDQVYRISPADGKILGKVDFSTLFDNPSHDPDDVLNGIAYDPEGDHLYVTGKRWPKLFEVKLKKKG